MPTKPNRAGQQQNYVPQGNGDASGEYADNASGSNIHFTNFKKPDEKSFSAFNKQPETPKEEVKAEQPKKENDYLGGSKAKTDFYLSLITSGISSQKSRIENEEEFMAKLKNSVANSNEDAIKVLQYLFDNHPVEFTENRYNSDSSYYEPAMRQIYIDKNKFDRGFEEQGSPLFHELGHCLNDTFKIREQVQWYNENHSMTDAYFLFDDNVSVADTLQEELKEFSANKHAPKIRKDKYKYVNSKLKEYGFTAEDYEKLTDEGKQALHNSEEWQNIRARIQKEYDAGRITIKDANQEVRKQLEIWKKNGSYKNLFAKLDEQRPLYVKFCNEWYKASGIQGVSDAWSSKSDFGFGLGHSRDYYSKKKYSSVEPKSLVADEFFANFFAAYTTNDKPALETTQKYFPRTYDKMLKLVDYIKSIKTKVDQAKNEIGAF